MNTLKWVPLMGSLVISERAWRSLPKNLRPKLAEAAERAAAKLRTAVRKDSVEAIRVMQGYGLTVHEATPDEIAIWQTVTRSFFDPMIGSYINGDLVAKIEKNLDVYRASH